LKILLEDYKKTWTVLTENLVSINHGGYHFISELIKPPYKTRAQAVLSMLLYKNVHNAELLSAGAGEIVFLTALTLAKSLYQNGNMLGNETETMELWTLAMEKLRWIIENSLTNVTEKELKQTILSTCSDDYPNLGEACWEAVKLAGLEGRVFIENGKQENFVVELKEGYTFGLKPYKFFLNKGKWEHHQCKVLTVDGFIESVAEIDQILVEAHAKKQPVALISHGFSEEVVSTLYTNYQRKLLNVIPLRLMSDVNSLNVINDIGIVCGRDPVSSLKGELVSCVKYEDLPVVKKMLVSDQETTIENFKTRETVFAQIKALLEKREENRLIEDIQNILDKRIRSLSPNAVKLYLPEMSAIENDSARIKLDLALRRCKTLLNHGCLLDYDFRVALSHDAVSPGRTSISTLVSNEFEEQLFFVISDLGFYMKHIEVATSGLGIYTGLLIGSKVALMLLVSSGMVEVEK